MTAQPKLPRTRKLALLCAASAILLGSLAGSACRRSRAVDVTRFVQANTEEVLVTYESEAELKQYVTTLRKALYRGYGDAKSEAGGEAPAAEAAPADDGDSGGDESITNTQEAGVDEGGIVKARGDYLIVMRRGRLFTVRLGDKEMRPVSMIDVFPPGSNRHTWYDEMLVHKNTIIVIGYSYDAGGTELNLFDMDGDGGLKYRTSYVLRSNDYYSSRNYASRLAGDKLIFYMPYSLVQGGGEDLSLPGLRPFTSARDDWNSIIKATDVYRPIQKTEWPVLHTVVVCDLAQKRNFDCKATGIIGPYGRTFYVSKEAVYVWVSDGYSGHSPRSEIDQAPSVVYRLPLDGGKPGALRTWGAPVDQFSFKQDKDGFLNVLVRAEGAGDWMWAPEITAGDVALLRVPVAAITTEVPTAKRSAFANLPRPGGGYTLQNRFVGDHVLFGTGSSWGGYRPPGAEGHGVYVYPYAGGDAVSVRLPHGVDRIEALGKNAVVVGTDGKDLHFSAIELGKAPERRGSFVQKHAAQGETRSHGFFYKPSSDHAGVLGLPIRRSGAPGYEQLIHGSAEILFLDVDRFAFERLGALASSKEVVDDRCIVSCVDWYGNARPIFYRGRVFALLGYELVEGRIADGRITEVGRSNMIRSMLPRIAP